MVQDFLVDKKQNLVDNTMRYIVNVLIHSSLITEPSDKEQAKLIQSFVEKENMVFNTISVDPEDEIITALDILLVLTNIDKVEQKIEYDLESLKHTV